MDQIPRVKRKKTKINRDTSRVITRLHIPHGQSRVANIIARVMNLSEEASEALMAKIFLDFFDRHKDIRKILLRHFDQVAGCIPDREALSETKRFLIGAYFTMEYSIESAALFNPSIVPHPDQSHISEGQIRFIMSFRAIGEGHISSIVFRSGTIDDKNTINFDTPSEYVETPDLQLNPNYDRHLFELKLNEMNAADSSSAQILEGLSENFTFNDLCESLDRYCETNDYNETVGIIKWLANSNYELKFSPIHRISERVIFPVSESERSGIEDARFVRFVDDDGEITYYATYTAYNGVTILPNLIETKDFVTFRAITLNGKAVQNKGMALFPRKINGKYAMLSRQDGENNHIMFSEHLHFWQESSIIQEPAHPWEFIQLGNCGSPLETDRGWLVLTHGVGPMRQYCLGAILLDLEDPGKLIARLKEPFMAPHEAEREGYVPNVLYSCGALIHNGEVIIPYAMSDIASAIATMNLEELLNCMAANGV
ncbi:MAG: glycoside hydrolase family 130 protein [Gammaproteobacteria bacterium]